MTEVRSRGTLAFAPALFAILIAVSSPTFALDEELLDEICSNPRGFVLTMSLAETTGWDAVISWSEVQTPVTVPGKARKLFRRALKADRRGRTEEAVKLLRRSLELAPGYFQAHAALAVGYLKLGDVRQARHHVSIALAVNPEYLPGREIKGIVCLVEGRYEESAAILSELARRSPTRRTVHYYLAKALLRTGETRLAEEHLTRATALLRQQSIPRILPGIPGWKPSDLHLPWQHWR